jgi:CheY-like chemotaxis protein
LGRLGPAGDAQDDPDLDYPQYLRGWERGQTISQVPIPAHIYSHIYSKTTMITMKPSSATPTKVLHKRILVAEDEPGVREALVLLLSLDEHLVTQATNGRQALELFKGGEFDLVITDYLMPYMKGDELAAHIHLIKPRQPVIVISAHAQTLADSGSPLVGISAVMGKPFMLADIRATIARLLGSQEDAAEADFLPN